MLAGKFSARVVRGGCLGALLVVLVAVAAGCGGSSNTNHRGSSSSTTGSTRALAQFRREANSACSTYLRKIAEVRPPTTPGALRSYVARASSLAASGERQLRGLAVSSHLAATAHQAVALDGKEVDVFRQLAAGLKSQPVKKILPPLSRKLTTLQNRARADWQRLGVESCSQAEGSAAGKGAAS